MTTNRWWQVLVFAGLTTGSVPIWPQEAPAPTTPPPSQESTTTPSATNPAEIQALRDRLELVQKQNEERAKGSQDKVSEFNRKLAEMSKQLAAAKDSAEQIKSLSAIVQQTLEKLETIELNSRNAANQVVDVDKIRYLTGAEIQKVIVHNAATLQVSTSLGSSLSSFQKTMNPEQDEDFKRELDALQATVSRGRRTFLEKVEKAGWFSNPLVSLAVSIGTFVVEGAAGEKLDRFANVVCLNQFASQNVADVRVVDEEIRNLDARVAEFALASETRFGVYASAVKYSGGYKDVVTAINNTGQDPLRAQADAFFNALPRRNSVAEPLSPDYVTARFQVEKVKEYVAEYEDLLRDVDAFFNAFQQLVAKDAALTGDCSTKPSVVRAIKRLGELAVTIGNARAKFRTAYIGSVSAESKRILYSGQ